MLSVGPRLAPVDRPGRIVDLATVPRDPLAVALHRQLLQVRGKALQVLLVRQDRNGLRAEEIRVPDRQQTEQHRQVALERRSPEVLVHPMEAVDRKSTRLNSSHQLISY